MVEYFFSSYADWTRVQNSHASSFSQGGWGDRFGMKARVLYYADVPLQG